MAFDDSWLLGQFARLTEQARPKFAPDAKPTSELSWWARFFASSPHVRANTPTPVTENQLLEVMMDSRSGVTIGVLDLLSLQNVRLEWTAPVAQKFIELLPHLDRSRLDTLTELGEQLSSRAQEARRCMRSARPAAMHDIERERQRIAAIPKPDDKKGDAVPEDLSKQQRRQLRSRVGELQTLEKDLLSTAAQFDILQQEWRHWAALGEITRQAHESPDAATGVAKALIELGEVYGKTLALLREMRDAVTNYAPESKVADLTQDSAFPQTVPQICRALARFFEPPVTRFLKLPGEEANAHFQKMFANIGGSALLGLSALAGLVGMFAYVKAVNELKGLGPSTLISVGDIADFTSRLAVPFVLLLTAFIFLVLIWVTTLNVDHRHRLRFTVRVSLVFLGLAAIFWAFRHWAPTVEPGMDGASRFLRFTVAAGLIPAVALLGVGLFPGVHGDDLVQRIILVPLRFVAMPIGVLVAFIVIGLVLVGTPRVSVLHAHESLEPDPNHTPQALVLERKQPGGFALTINPDYSRLSNAWLVKYQPPPWPTPHQPESDAPGWQLVSPAEVICVREISQGERGEEAIHNACNIPSPEPFLTDTVAYYATQQLGCKRSSFTEGPRVTVLQFPVDLPKTVKAAEGWAVSKDSPMWSIPAVNLSTPGLAGTRVHSGPLDQMALLLQRLAEEPASTIWVVGFASTPGEPADNLNLSGRRALALHRILIHSNAIEDSVAHRIKELALGEGPLAGLLGIQSNAADQLAIAFLCRRVDLPH